MKDIENTSVPNVPKITYGNQVRGATEHNRTSQATIFGVDKVMVGIENPNGKEIAVRSDGYKYARNKVEGVEILNAHRQNHHCWFMLDLETGGRG